MITVKNGLRFALPLMAALISVSAWSQDTADDGVIEEIVVTARHRAESIQSVPISISAVSGRFLADQRINSLQALEHSVPNLVFGETGTSGETHIGIRGIGDFSRNIGFDTRVGVYIDGVFAGQSLAVDQGLLAGDRGRLLRGRHRKGQATGRRTRRERRIRYGRSLHIPAPESI